MAFVSSGRNQALQNIPLVARLGEIAAEFRAAAETRRVFRRTLAELQGLSLRELNDLGLHPSNLRQIAWETALAETQDRKPV